MAETLGMLCDKLTIIKLKQYHSDDQWQLSSLKNQAKQLQNEIDEYITFALNGLIPINKLTFASNKVFKKKGNELSEIKGNIGELFFLLAEVNCKLWHEVEKGYNIEDVPENEKNSIVKNLAVLNLERNNCIDEIDRLFQKMIEKKTNG